jgi:AraC-like DNA-binding protein
MAVLLKNLREIHRLGAATREWLVSSRRVPALGGSHTRIAGYTEARAGYTFVRHDPHFSMILVTESGEGRVWIDGGWQPCPAGHAYLTAPRAACAYHIKPGSRWRLHWVIYEEAANLPSMEPGRAPRLLRVEATGLRHAVEGLCHENAGRGDPAVLGFWATLVDRMALRVLETESSDPRLDRLWLAVGEDLGSPWTLPRMARVAGMGEENLRRVCQGQLRCPPMAHLARLRMLMAADLLCHTQEKIASVAARLGYSDAFAFSTAFKRIMGHSPKRFRLIRP